MTPSKSFWQLVVLFLSAPIASAATNILVWPPPPDPARIAFTQCIQQPADAGARQSGVRRFANWFSGAAVGNEKLSKPFGIAVDDQGGLCLTDTGLNTVAWLDPSSKRWRQWDRVGDIRFSAPVAVAKNGSVLFVADSGLGAVMDAFLANFVERGDLGAGCAVYVDARPVVDVWGGTADRRTGRAWNHDTAAVIFSCSKGLLAMCAYLLVQQGRLEPVESEQVDVIER